MSDKLNTIYGSADFLNVLQNQGIIPEQTAPIVPTDSAPVPVLPNLEGEPGSGNLKLNLQGDVMSGPNPGITPNNSNSFAEIFSNLASQTDKWAANPYEKAKPFAWGSNEMNENFYRFYNHPRYKDLGFSPFRDNETFYNENSSAWDDFGRTFGAWKNLFGTAFKSSILFGAAYDGGSEQMAREFIDANNQGASTRGGIAGFANNLVLNSAYTVGLVTALTAENLAIAGTTAGLSMIPGGQAAAGATFMAGVTRNIYGLGKIAQGLKLTSQSLNFVRNLNKVDNARDFYNMAKNGTVAIGKFLNPLEESTQFIKSLSDLKKTTDLTKNYALMGRGVGSFYVDMRNIYVAYSEGALEGGMVKKELGDKFISDYYEKNGVMPEGEAADKIYNNINEAKANTTLYNLPIILYTNKIVLPNFSRLFPTFAKTAGTIAGETSQNVFKQAADWKLGKDFYQKGVKTFRDKAVSVITKGATPWSLRYVKANVGEGVQELYQEGLAAGIEDYYTSVYSDPAYAGFIESASKAVNSQISKQGLEVFASGFLMGGLIQGPQTLVTSYIPKKIFQYTKPEQYKQTVERAEQREVENMNSANVLLKNILGFTENNLENAVRVKAAAETMDRAILEGRQNAFQNAQDDLLFEHTFNLLRNGRTELLTDAISSFKTMKDEELSEAFEVDKVDVPALRKRLDSSLNQISNLDQQYKEINKKWPKPDFLNVKDTGDAPVDTQEIIRLSRYHDFAVKMLLFNRNAFQRSLERKESILRNLNSDNKLKDLSDFDFNTLADEMLGINEINTLKNQIASLNLAEKPDTKEISKLESKLDLLNKFWNTIGERRQISKDDVDALEENERLLFNLYKGYLNQNAKRKGQPVFNDQIKKSFIDLMDTHVLTEDSLDFANQINILDSPEWFYDLAKSRNYLLVKSSEKFKNDIDKAYDEFKRIEKVNNLLLTKLDEKNFFLLADQINNYVRNNVIPTEIYDGNTKLPVEPGTPRYDEAQAIIAEVLEEEVKAEQAVKEAAEKEAKSIIEKLKNINSSVLLNIQRNNYSIIEFDDLDENQKTALKKLRIGASDKELDEFSKTLQLKRIDEQINQEFAQLFKELDTIYKSIYNKSLGEYIKEVYGKDPKGTASTNVLRYYFALYSPAGQELIDKYNENKPDDQKISKPPLEVVEEQAPVTKPEEEVVTSAPVVTPAPAPALASDIEKIVITEENYNAWSNVRDKSDFQAFVNQVKSTIASFDQIPDKSKITPENVDVMLASVKAFANKTVRDKIVPLIVAKYKTLVSDTLGFENLGNIGNQGLVIMETEINKTGKSVLPNISKATPEQRKKIDSDIEELKKKYPEKNITSKVENDNLIVESGVTAPASNIEAEKQKITPSEFKEVVRLAKFFLENPSEPGVMGDARSRYPELFKAVTDIERRRQEELKPYKQEYVDSLIKRIKEKSELEKFGMALGLYSEGRYNPIVALNGIGHIKEKGIVTKNTLINAVYNIWGELEGDKFTQFLESEENSSQGLGRSAKEQINAKYDAELDALEGAKPSIKKTHRELKKEVADRLNSGEKIIGTIQKVAQTRFVFTSPDGTVLDFYNRISGDVKEISVNDLIKQAELISIGDVKFGNKLFKDVVEVRVDGKLVGYVRENSDQEFEEQKKQRQSELKEQVLKQIDEVITLLREAQSKLDEKLFEQANAIVSDINYNTNATEEQRTYVNEIYDQAVKILEVAPMIEKNKNVTLTGGITYQIIKVNPKSVMVQKVKIVNGIAEITGTPEKVNKLELAQNIVKPDEITITKKDETNAQDTRTGELNINKAMVSRKVFEDNIPNNCLNTKPKTDE